MKTSSTGTSAGFRLGPARLNFRDWLPLDVSVSRDSAGSAEVISGTLPEKRMRHIVGQPHVALANLPSLDSGGRMRTGVEPSLRMDTKAVEKFVKDYGALYAKDLPRPERVFFISPINAATLYAKDDPEPVYVPHGSEFSFRESIADFAVAQLQLRKAWSGDLDAYFEMQKELDFQTSLEFPDKGLDSMLGKARPGKRIEAQEDEKEGRHGVRVETRDLWTFIRLLFLAGVSEDKIAVCANPECLVPFFVKRRKSQRLCEQGECVKWAQRQYSLQWWNAPGGGKERREKKQSKQRNKKRKKQ